MVTEGNTPHTATLHASSSLVMFRLTTCKSVLQSVTCLGKAAEKPPPLPVFKTYKASYKSKSNGIMKWEDIYCDAEKGLVKRVLLSGANKDQTTKFYMEKDGEHGLEVTYYGKYGMPQYKKKCSYWRGTAKYPVKTDQFILDLSQSKYELNTKWYTIDVEVWKDKDFSHWVIRRDGEKLTPLEHVMSNNDVVEVKSFSDGPIDDIVFKYRNEGNLEECEEEQLVQDN